jgi:4'-phosphopantetheinyl transferase
MDGCPATSSAKVRFPLDVDGIGGLEGLRGGDVHVWYAHLELEAGAVGRLAARLSEDERVRAGRFKFARDARRLEFAYGEHGKPALEGAHAALGFNLSHSGEIAVLAAGWNRALGVDVELRRPLPDLDALAARSFAPRELSVLGALPETDRPAAFFRCWTRKEAFIKATGQGLAQRLDAFVVSLAPDEPARFLDIDGDPGALARWTLHDLTPPAGYAGALVVEGAVRAVQARTWSATGPG